ncbi:NAD(P)H-hydrate dehydratase [Oceanobacillus sp. FSL W7-1309]|uniref:NAD(P)H-hydrate dehydratase n=1 Tax=Oceanobacillus sp. FSL W7-1309 TaxID=2954539 RepID=UPI0030F9CE70
MYIVTAKEMYDIDDYTISKIGLEGKLLMENAGRAVSERVIKLIRETEPVCIFIGAGNNGGDGFVIARVLLDKGYLVQVVQVVPDEKITGDALFHKRVFIQCGGEVSYLTDLDLIREKVERVDVVIDAIIGIGVKGVLREPIQEMVRMINHSKACVISVDIPSGLPADEGIGEFTSIQADYTFVIAAAKESSFMVDTADFYGQWEIVPIGIPNFVFQNNTAKRQWAEEDFGKTIPSRNVHAHKGSHGKGLIIGGCSEMPGSLAMATKAALKAGAGLVASGTTEKVISMIAAMCPEATYMILPEKDGYITGCTASPISNYDAIAVGIGLGRREETRHVVAELLNNAPCPLLIDADGLYHLKYQLEMLKQRSEPTIITPHPGEMAMLLGISISDLLSAPFHYTRDFAKANRVYIILKGKHTIITSPEGRQAVESSGNPGLAKGGTGDVLTGISLAMMMQQQELFDALCNACFIHGKSADIQIEEKQTYYDLMATDVIDGISKVYRAFPCKRV